MKLTREQIEFWRDYLHSLTQGRQEIDALCNMALAALDGVRVPMPDPEQDFERFVTASMEQAIANLPTENKMEHYVLRSAQRLLKFVEKKAPTFVIEREKRILQRRAGELPVYCADYDDLDAAAQGGGRE